MSYSFGMFFKQVKDKNEAFAIALQASNLYYKNAKEVLNNERYYIPSVRDDSDQRSADRFWLNEVFTLGFVYWDKHKLLGLSGYNYPKEVTDLFDCHVTFQNSCDQDYDFDTWDHKINLFREYKVRYQSMPENELKFHLGSDYEDEDLNEREGMLDYYRRSLFYSFIYDELHLNNWLWDHEDRTFERFAINSLNSSEKKMEAYRFLRAEVKKYQEEFDAMDESSNESPKDPSNEPSESIEHNDGEEVEEL